jgi:outer membrane protein TolC
MLTAVLVLLAAAPMSQASAMDMASLLAAAREQPDIQEKELAVVEADLRVTEANAALFPKLGLYGRYENYSTPTNMRPFFPTEGNAARGDSLEFSRQISR